MREVKKDVQILLNGITVVDQLANYITHGQVD